ncbi:unnamed protein product [Boreogadus saida]
MVMVLVGVRMVMVLVGVRMVMVLVGVRMVMVLVGVRMMVMVLVGVRMVMVLVGVRMVMVLVGVRMVMVLVGVRMVLVGVRMVMVLVGVRMVMVLVGVRMVMVLVGVRMVMVLVGVRMVMVLVGVRMVMVLVGVRMMMMTRVVIVWVRMMLKMMKRKVLMRFKSTVEGHLNGRPSPQSTPPPQPPPPPLRHSFTDLPSSASFPAVTRPHRPASGHEHLLLTPEAVLDMLSGAAPLPPLRRQAVDHVKYLPREGLDHPHLTAAQGAPDFQQAPARPPKPFPRKAPPAPEVPHGKSHAGHHPPPPPPPPSCSSSSSSSSSSAAGCESADAKIAKLMGEGYSFEDVKRALMIAQNKVEVARNILREFALVAPGSKSR